MDTFLKQIAQRIVADHPKDTDQVLVVFNNNRSRRFFNKEFSTLGQTTFLPQVKTIDEMIVELSGLEIVPNEFLLFKLYEIHKDLEGEKRKYETFEDFISFGDLMIGDFSEIDQYMVPAEEIFDNLHRLKEIGEWDLSGEELTERQKQYLRFYRSLYNYYTQLHERLREKGQAYSGMAYRTVAEDIEHKAKDYPYSDIYFIGFNALSKCEETIIGHFVSINKGHLLTDFDIYYTEAAQRNEAGFFLQKHKQKFPELKPTAPSCFATYEKNIHMVDCPEKIMQCKFTGQLLASHPQWLDSAEAESTAIVLADEKLLIPTLNALPDIGGKKYNVNVTMGYAYADSMIHALTEKVISLYRQHNQRGYYYKDVVDVVSDQFVSRLTSAKRLRNQLENLMRTKNLIRCNEKEAKAAFEKIGADVAKSLLFLFPDGECTPQMCLNQIRKLAMAILDNGMLDSGNNSKEKQAMGSLAEILSNLEELMESNPDTVSTIDTFEKIYSRIAARHSISLIGEPLKGLQVLGMLETRNLDFKRVILLSTNEGILPGGHTANTLIPLFLKRKHGLPTYVEKDKVFAYHFYHLLQRAEEVYLLYSTENEATGKGEASRFVRQVTSELAPQYHINLERISVKADTTLVPVTPKDSVEKTPEIMQWMQVLGENGLAPTSFCDFMDCPLKYYYTRVLKAKENETVEEDLDSAQLGSSIHKVLQTIYEKHLDKLLSANVLGNALDHLKELMDESFENLFSGGRNNEGRNRFLYEVAERQLRHILKQEKEQIEHGDKIIVRGVETELFLNDIVPGVKLKGTIDRVDEKNGCLRIIDYKTGSLEDIEIKYPNKSETMYGKWLQLMWYALLYCRANGTPGKVNAGIYPLRNLRADVNMASWKLDGDKEPTLITSEKLELFEQMLREKIEELMDPNIPFIATPTKKGCKFCAARNYCSRYMPD